MVRLIFSRQQRALSEEQLKHLKAWINESPEHAKFMEIQMHPEIIAERLRILSEMDQGSHSTRRHCRTSRLPLEFEIAWQVHPQVL